MEKASVASIKEYAYELLDYSDSFYALVDVIARILLWRGRILVTLQKPKCLLRKDTR